MSLLTEEDARKRWCPFVRIAGPQGSEAAGTSYNRWPGGQHEDDVFTLNSKCVGSRCMAWRPSQTEAFKNMAEARYRLDGRRLSSDTGYCGLAGPVTP